MRRAVSLVTFAALAACLLPAPAGAAVTSTEMVPPGAGYRPLAGRPHPHAV